MSCAFLSKKHKICDDVPPASSLYVKLVLKSTDMRRVLIFSSNPFKRKGVYPNVKLSFNDPLGLVVTQVHTLIYWEHLLGQASTLVAETLDYSSHWVRNYNLSVMQDVIERLDIFICREKLYSGIT